MIAVLMAGGAAAQTAPNPNLRPLHGDVHLSGGFLPDPHDVRVTTGGPIHAGGFRSGCAGYITEAPTVSVHWTGGSGALPLFFTTTDAARDPTILVRDPRGNWHCDDDGGVGLNPLFETTNNQSGRYDVWIGAFAGSGGSAVFRVTELARHATGENPSTPVVSSRGLTSTPRAVITGMTPNHRLSPRFGHISLTSGFLPDPHSVQVTAGGSVRADGFSSSCVGFISDEPTARLNWRSGSSTMPLLIAADASADTTLVVRAPDGAWYCNDDGAGSLNPLFADTRPQSGVYDIWVGRFSRGTAPATLRISEMISNVSTLHGGDDDDDLYCDLYWEDDPDCW